ncbi:hypothetical protein FOZ76_21210 [Verticiella sediminum]|uniref:Periplasmic copper-binding protein NosD beta helix domain-containing protein n=1 Tax=Verticiella sediminum TaxID=1247510 RepID=A0A556ABS5_9BURK|nr:NosD domain-containing protein [Verticiella sediminum]TSH90346.1 hypothetical protein FOZ76_21210 [Verticiella sediminum]
MQRFNQLVITQASSGLVFMPGATVSVYLNGTSTLTDIYSANDPGAVMANPFPADASGNADFYARNGRYDVRVEQAGYPTVTIEDVLLSDPADEDYEEIIAGAIQVKGGQVSTAEEDADAPIPSVLEDDGAGPLNVQAEAFLKRLNAFRGSDGSSLVGFVAGRSVSARLNEYVSVWDYASLITERPDANDPSTWTWTPAIAAALSSAATLRRTVRLPEIGIMMLSQRVTVPPGVRLHGSGMWASTLKLKPGVNDRVLVLMEGAVATDLSVDASGNQDGTLSAATMLTRSTAERVRAINGYSGIALSEAHHCTLRDIVSDDNQSRGVILDPFSSFNRIAGLSATGNGNAGILFGHGASDNLLDGFDIQSTNNPGIWFHQGVKRNRCRNGIISSPISPGMVAINITANAQYNEVTDTDVIGHDRVVQFIGIDVDGVHASIPNGDTSNNLIRVRAVGNSTMS